MAPLAQPPIILITTDQQRYDTTGPLAPPFMRTPHFDHLASEGVTFSRAYSDCPLCVPARLSIMTGKTILNHGQTGNVVTSQALGRDNTLPSLLRELGYQTAAVGKMHFGPQRARHGFDEMIIPDDYYRHMARLGYATPQPMHHGLGQNELYPTLSTVPEALSLTSWIAEQCVEYIKVRRDPTVPFFLWCSFSKPHPPLDPPEPYYSMYRNCDIPEPDLGDWCECGNCPPGFVWQRQMMRFDQLSPQIIREARAAYLGLITQCDYNMGRLFAALQDHDLFNDALILYTSDHGEFLGDHRAGSKTFFHESSAHIPFLMRLPKSWPDRLHGQVCRSLATHADILPTLLRAAGGQPPPDCDGVDLLAVARGHSPGRATLEATNTLDPTQRPTAYLAITDGRWKYMFFAQGGAELLFDIDNDPRELRNLVGLPEFADAHRRLRVELIARASQRGLGYVRDGDFVAQPVSQDSVEDRRNRSWPGYHTEFHTVDVRH